MHWIGNPTNHSGTTVSVSPSCLSAHVLTMSHLANPTSRGTVDWDCDKGDSSGNEVVCLVRSLVQGSLYFFMLKYQPPWVSLVYSKWQSITKQTFRDAFSSISLPSNSLRFWLLPAILPITSMAIKVIKIVKSTSGEISIKTTTKTVGQSMPMYRGWGEQL